MDPSAQLLRHVRGAGGGELTEEIGAWRRNRAPCRANQCARGLVCWEAHPNAREPCAHKFGNRCGCGGNNRERPWPEGIRERAHARITERTGGEDVGEFRAISNVHDQWVKGWSTLRRKDPCNGDRIRCVSAETVDRLRGKGDKFSFAKQRGSTWNRSCDLIWVAGVE